MTTESAHPNLATAEPTCGRVVWYVLKDGPCAGEIRPAFVITTAKAKGWAYPEHERVVQLQVMLDGTNDLPNHGVTHEGKPDAVAIGNPGWKTGVVQDQEGKKPGTWHWMPYQLTKESVASKEAPAAHEPAEKHTDKIEKPHAEKHVAEKTKHK